jgi:hypothetical protein
MLRFPAGTISDLPWSEDTIGPLAARFVGASEIALVLPNYEKESAGKLGISVRDRTSGEVTSFVALEEIGQHRHFQFSQDGQRLLGWWVREFAIWEVESGALVLSARIDGQPSDAILTPKGGVLLLLEDGFVLFDHKGQATRLPLSISGAAVRDFEIIGERLRVFWNHGYVIWQTMFDLSTHQESVSQPTERRWHSLMKYKAPFGTGPRHSERCRVTPHAELIVSDQGPLLLGSLTTPRYAGLIYERSGLIRPVTLSGRYDARPEASENQDERTIGRLHTPGLWQSLIGPEGKE